MSVRERETMVREAKNLMPRTSPRLTRRRFLAGTLAAAGLGVLPRLGRAASGGQGKMESALKYNIKNMRLLVENGGQTDWARHDPELITYCRLEKDGFWDVWTIRSDGAGLAPLTVDEPGIPRLNNANPGWHPSGKYIAFQGERDRFFGDRFLSHPGVGGFCNVWLGKSDGSRFWQLTDLPCAATAEEARSKPVTGVLMPKFSHNGKKLHWSQWQSPGPKGEKGWWWDIRVADFIDDEQNPRLANVTTYNPGPGPFKECFMFTPDDKKLLLAGNLEPGLAQTALDLYLLDLTTGRVENLTRTPTAWEEGCKMSPDGKKIFFGSNEGYEHLLDPKNPFGTRQAEYWIMDADGSNKRRLTWFHEPGHPFYRPGQTHAAVVSWAPDGRRLSACMGSGDKLEVRIIELE